MLPLRFAFCLALASIAMAQNPFEPYLGFYSIVGSEKPKSFVDFDNFVITEAAPGMIRGRVVPPQGKVRDFLRAKLADGALTFETRRLNGVSYSFSGQFLKAPPVPVDGKTPVLEGIVARLRMEH